MQLRKIFSCTRELADRIVDYRFERRIASEGQAIRELIEAGLKAKARKP